MQQNFETDRPIMTATDLQRMGFSRSRVYELLNRTDMPVIIIGGRKYMHRQRFLDWLDAQATSEKKGA